MHARLGRTLSLPSQRRAFAWLFAAAHKVLSSPQFAPPCLAQSRPLLLARRKKKRARGQACVTSMDGTSQLTLFFQRLSLSGPACCLPHHFSLFCVGACCDDAPEKSNQRLCFLNISPCEVIRRSFSHATNFCARAVRKVGHHLQAAIPLLALQQR